MPDTPAPFVPDNHTWFAVFDPHTDTYYNGQHVFTPNHAWVRHIGEAMLYPAEYVEQHQDWFATFLGTRLNLIPVSFQLTPFLPHAEAPYA